MSQKLPRHILVVSTTPRSRSCGSGTASGTPLSLFRVFLHCTAGGGKQKLLLHLRWLKKIIFQVLSRAIYGFSRVHFYSREPFPSLSSTPLLHTKDNNMNPITSSSAAEVYHKRHILCQRWDFGDTPKNIINVTRHIVEGDLCTRCPSTLTHTTPSHLSSCSYYYYYSGEGVHW